MADRDHRDAAGPTGPGGSAPWVRARLRAAPAGGLAMGLLVLVTAFLAAAVPRQVAAQENTALRQSLERAPLLQRTVTVYSGLHHAQVRGGERLPTPEELAGEARKVRDIARPPFAPDQAETVTGIRTVPVEVPDNGLPRPPGGYEPRLTLHAGPRDADRHMRLVSGRMPGPDVRDGTVEAVITEGTARTMKLRTGSTLTYADAAGVTMTVRVSGTVAARDPDSAHWRAEPDLLEPAQHTVPGPVTPWPRFWHFTAFVDSGAQEVLLRFEGGARVYQHHPLLVRDVSASDAAALRSSLASLSAGADEARLREESELSDPDVVADDLIALLDAFEEERATSRALVLTAAVGVGAAALVVLALAGVLAATARRSELELLRARGGSLAGIGGRLLAETSAVAVPAAAAGTAAAVLWVPAPGLAVPLVTGASVALVAALVLPSIAMTVLRGPGTPVRGDLAATRPSRRRTVLELTVVALALSGLVAVRRGIDSGTGTGGTSDDPLTAAAPVLLAVVAALALMRLYPLPLRLLARPAARLRGLVTPLALARLGRAPAVSALPLLAVLVALTVSAFGGAVLSGVTEGRAAAALAEVGADARVEAPRGLPAGVAESVARTPGVTATTPVRIEHRRTLEDAPGRTFTLVAVDPRQYARLVARTGLDGGEAFPAGPLGRADGDGPAPAVVSPGLAKAVGEGTEATVDAESGPVRVRVVAVRAETPAATGDFMVVPTAALKESRPTALLLAGTGLDSRALKEAAPGEGVTVSVRTERQAGYGTGPLQDGTRLIHLVAVAAGLGYGVLALLLWLTQSAPERRTLLTRLRAIGTGRRQGLGLACAETLPLTLVGVAGGVATALATLELLRPGVDLTPLAFSARMRASGEEAVRAGLAPDAGSLLWPSLLLLALAVASAAVQAWPGGTREDAERLRTGDRE
ncbi:ABC transporter permease [Streptomyces sp. MUM 203J]|uniref:ABC transporter permease n=1 Tax=Streptomyces sp. MUM 203J TaxID=2791990 RepID=UPI001F04A706|nr:ABC transporter permease [Streptomyces sp. MUM 203J]MCH0539004.1 ABC transporter permease [Streptomyces sp. MUM 203J]